MFPTPFVLIILNLACLFFIIIGPRPLYVSNCRNFFRKSDVQLEITDVLARSIYSFQMLWTAYADRSLQTSVDVLRSGAGLSALKHAPEAFFEET